MTRELTISAVLGLSALLTASVMLNLMHPQFSALQWFLQGALLWGFVWQQTWQRRTLNRLAPDTANYPNLGLANRLTLLRGWMIAATGGFLFMPLEQNWIGWIPAALYSSAAILDRIDGYVARLTARTSVLGNELDTVFDALGLLVAPLLAVMYGKVHWSYLLVSIAYYCFVWGLHWRRTHHRPVYPLTPSTLRRTLAGFQMGYVAVVLWPTFNAQITVPAGVGFMLPLLAGFAVDWLVVSGRLDPARSRPLDALQKLGLICAAVLQPALRVVMCLSLLQLPWAPATALDISLWIASLLVLTGCAARVGAVSILALIAWHYPYSLEPALFITLFSAITVLLLGAGRFSLWQWDDRWVNRQDGA